MSHFIGLVFCKDLDKLTDLIAPYDENHIVDPPILKYTNEQAIRHLIDEFHKGNLNLNDTETVKSIINDRKACLKFFEEYYGYIRDFDGFYSSTNEQGKYDWYTIEDSRWGNYLPLKEGTAQIAQAKDIDWKVLKVPHCFVTTNGVWHEKSELWWWCMTKNEKDDNSWAKEFYNYVKTVDKDTLVVAIDFHI